MPVEYHTWDLKVYSLLFHGYTSQKGRNGILQYPSYLLLQRTSWVQEKKNNDYLGDPTIWNGAVPLNSFVELANGRWLGEIGRPPRRRLPSATSLINPKKLPPDKRHIKRMRRSISNQDKPMSTWTLFYGIFADNVITRINVRLLICPFIWTFAVLTILTFRCTFYSCLVISIQNVDIKTSSSKLGYRVYVNVSSCLEWMKNFQFPTWEMLWWIFHRILSMFLIV